MTVDDQVIGRCKRIAVCLHKGAAIVRVVLFKVVLQVIVGVCRCLHHGIVDAGALDLKPADQVRILLIQLLAFGKKTPFTGIKVRSRSCQLAVQRCLLRGLSKIQCQNARANEQCGAHWELRLSAVC